MFNNFNPFNCMSPNFDQNKCQEMANKAVEAMVAMNQVAMQNAQNTLRQNSEMLQQQFQNNVEYVKESINSPEKLAEKNMQFAKQNMQNCQNGFKNVLDNNVKTTKEMLDTFNNKVCNPAAEQFKQQTQQQAKAAK